MERKYIIEIIIVIVFIGCIFLAVNKINSDKELNDSTEYLQVSQNGVSILAPGDWVKASSQSNSSILAVADPNSKDSSGFNNVSVNIERKNITDSLSSEFSNVYDTLSYNSAYEVSFIGNVSGIGGYDGMEADYTSNISDVPKQHKAIWIEKDGYAYVILCTAPQSSFANYENIFKQIIGNFKFT